MSILFKATSEEADALRKDLKERYPAEGFSMSKLSYPSYNDIHCFELQVNPGERSDEIRAYIIDKISGISASKG